VWLRCCAASLASWIVQRVSETETANQAATASNIDQLRYEIRTLADQLSAASRNAGPAGERGYDSGHQPGRANDVALGGRAGAVPARVGRRSRS